MSRTLYESLGQDGSPADPEGEVSPLLRAFVRAAARHRAARELAQEEHLLGAWVTTEAEPAAEAAPLRLAAQDHDDAPAADYRGGAWRLHLWRDPTGEVWVRQDEGPAGVTLRIEGREIPLQPGLAASLGRRAALPPSLRLLDAHGRTWTLARG